MGLQQQVICGNQCNSAAFLSQAGPAAEGLIVGATWNINVSNEASTTFVDAYRKKYNEDPDQFAAQAYTAIYVLADALKRAGSTDPAKLRDAIQATAGLTSPLGPFSFDGNREPQIQPAIQVVTNGSFALFH
jgi:branched-chain amino acid transport system substrate-binding protein